MTPPVAILDEIDKECRVHGLPPLSWVVRNIPGRANASQEQIDSVWKAAREGKYDLMGIKPNDFGGH